MSLHILHFTPFHLRERLGLGLLFISLFSRAQYAPVNLQRQVTSVQPMTGLVLWNDLAESKKTDYGQCFALEFTYCLPSAVVKGKQDGAVIYDWTSLETLLDKVASRGHQAILRFRYEYPGARTDGTRGATAVPAYIKELPDYNETYNADAGGDGPTYYADWSNAELQWFTKQFYTDFAARYDNDPRIAFLEVGFGHWSEYHIYGTRLQLGKNFPSKQYQQEFLTHLRTVFRTLPWLISIDAADDEYTPIVASSALMALPFGLFDDSFMHKGHEIGSNDGYNELNWRAIGSADRSANLTRWQTAPCGGEISYYTSSDQRNFLNPKGMYGVTWEQASAKYHISFMISNDALSGSYASPERFRQASMACGYHFAVTECLTSSSETRITVTNTGVAPLYKDAFFAIGSVRSSQSLKYLLPGQSLTCIVAAPLTNPNDLSIACDYLVAGQQIQFDGTASAAALQQVSMTGNVTRKYISSGNLYILSGGKTYNALGMQVQ